MVSGSSTSGILFSSAWGEIRRREPIRIGTGSSKFISAQRERWLDHLH